MKLLLFALLNLLVFSFSAANHFDAEALLYNSSVSISSSNKLTYHHKIIIRINNRNGEAYTNIRIPFSDTDKIKGLNAWIADGSGKIVRKLKKKDIVEVHDMEGHFYEDAMVSKFQLKHNVYPYEIHYEYTKIYSPYLSIARWSPNLFNKIPTRKAILQFNQPWEYKVRILQDNGLQYKVDTMETHIRHVWEGAHLEPAINDEIFSVPLSELVPSVRIVPLEYDYGVRGSFETWEDFGKWVFRLNEGQGDLPDPEKQRIERLVRGIDDPKEKAKMLYHDLQAKNRYINVSLGIGGLKTLPASYVAAKRYGDCKALTNYLHASLKHVGIESHYSLVHAGDTPSKINTQFPSQQFNHVILCLPFERDSVWLECTSDVVPFGYLGTFTQGRKSLITKEAKSELVKIPGLKREDLKDYCKNILTVNDSTGLVTWNAKRSAGSGNTFEQLLYLNANYNPQEKDYIIRRHFVPRGFELQNWNIQPDDAHALGISLNGSANHYFKRYGNDYIFPLLPSAIPQFETPQKRTLPVRIPYPIDLIDSAEYVLPDQWATSQSPMNNEIKSEYGEYSLRFELIGKNHLMVLRKYTLFPADYPIQEYAGFYEFMQQVYELDNQNLVFTKSH